MSQDISSGIIKLGIRAYQVGTKIAPRKFCQYFTEILLRYNRLPANCSRDLPLRETQI
jgi:hypothetical protein